MSVPQIIVLGAGLGGAIAADKFRDPTIGKANVTLACDKRAYWFVPGNIRVAVRPCALDAGREAIEADAALLQAEDKLTAGVWTLDVLTGDVVT